MPDHARPEASSGRIPGSAVQSASWNTDPQNSAVHPTHISVPVLRDFLRSAPFSSDHRKNPVFPFQTESSQNPVSAGLL